MPDDDKTPAGQGDQEQIPPYLKRLVDMPVEQRRQLGWTDEELDDAKRGYMQQSDYTRKTQQLAAYRKVVDRYKPEELEEGLQELDRWRNWRRGDGSNLESEREELADLRRRLAASHETKTPDTTVRRYEVSAEDLYDNEKMHAALGRLEDGFQTRALDATKKWWQTEAGTAVEKMAENYAATILNLMRPMWDRVMKETGVTIPELLKQTAARGGRDPGAVLDEMMRSATTSREGSFKEGYERGAKEAEERMKTSPNGGATTTTPTGPVGGSLPPWKSSTTTGAPKSYEDRMNAVLKEVIGRKGPLPL